MITCSDLQGRVCTINPDLLERIDSTPDTQLVFVNGRRMYVSETPDEIVERIVIFRRRIGVVSGSAAAWLSALAPEENGE